jgi:hypothetical protein
MDFTWVTPTDQTPLTTKGDLFTFTTVDARLAVGTNGYILSANSATATGLEWIAANPGDITGVTAGTGISGGGTSGDVTITNSMATAMTTKGDLVPATGSAAFARLGVGSNNQVLTADSTAATGMKWATPSSSSLPAFSAYGTSSQTPTVNVFTKIMMNAEVFDTASNFDTTNYRFLPTTAGYYQINGSLDMNTSSSGGHYFALYKNGSLLQYFSILQNVNGESLTTGGCLVYLDGSTDYVELYAKGTAGTVTLYQGAVVTTFTGVGVRT